MSKQFLMQVDVPDGWELVDFRVPRYGEFYLSDRQPEPRQHLSKEILLRARRAIVKKVESHRKPSVNDIGKMIEFSFSQITWNQSHFVGFDRNGNPVSQELNGEFITWKHARVEVEGGEIS